jgi:RNA polymerase sigma-70 factor, ECF subfamily
LARTTRDGVPSDHEEQEPVTDVDASRRFTAVFHEHHRRVFAYAVGRAGREHADDVVAETFLVAWRRLADVPANPLPWLLGVARNVVHERYRDQVRQSALAAEMRAWVREAEEDVAEHVTDRAAVLLALAALGDADREILTLIAWHGLAARDAARVVGCSTATFFVRLHRARKRLQDALGVDRQTSSARLAKEYTR